ncbi:MAG: P-loop NTPase [Halanaeroarchaeum sp.]
MLAIAGGKGGVGKTTTALGVGVALAGRRRDPVLVDADTDAPNLHLLADVADAGVTALADGADVADAATPSPRYEGVCVVGSRPGAPIERALRRLVTDRPVVVDAPAGAAPDAVLPLRVAEAAILVTTPDPAAVADARKTASIARSLDTDVVAWMVARSDRVPDAVARVAGSTPVVPVPERTDPPREAGAAFDAAVSAWVNA